MSRILHFTIAKSFSQKFLFHPDLTQAQDGAFEFVVGQSGYRVDRVAWRAILAEYLRAWRFLWRERGSPNRASVAYCHTTKFALPALILCRMLGVGRVVYFNHGVPYVGHSGIRGLALRVLERLNVAAAHDSITVSPGMVPLLNPGGSARAQVRSTQPGSSSGLLPSSFISPEQAKSHAVAAAESPSVRFLYAGRLQARKGVFVLLEAWTLHVARHPADVLVLCGFTEGELAAAGASTDVPGLELRGYVEPMVAVYDGVHIVVSPSFHEGFGYTLLEGAARGCAIVSADIPGPDVMFSAGMRGQMFSVGNPRSLGDLLSRLSADRRLLRRAMRLSFRAAQRFRTERVKIPGSSHATHLR